MHGMLHATSAIASTHATTAPRSIHQTPTSALATLLLLAAAPLAALLLLLRLLLLCCRRRFSVCSCLAPRAGAQAPGVGQLLLADVGWPLVGAARGGAAAAAAAAGSPKDGAHERRRARLLLHEAALLLPERAADQAAGQGRCREACHCLQCVGEASGCGAGDAPRLVWCVVEYRGAQDAGRLLRLIAHGGRAEASAVRAMPMMFQKVQCDKSTANGTSTRRACSWLWSGVVSHLCLCCLERLCFAPCMEIDDKWLCGDTNAIALASTNWPSKQRNDQSCCPASHAARSTHVLQLERIW